MLSIIAVSVTRLVKYQITNKIVIMRGVIRHETGKFESYVNG